MPTLNAATTLEQADDLAADFTGGDVVVREGATVLATHSISSWATSNQGNDGQAVPTVPDVNASASGTADTVVLKNGTLEVDITDSVTITQPEYIAGQNATVGSLSFTFPAVI